MKLRSETEKEKRRRSDMPNVQETRLSFKPNKGKTLFIGESPPVSGDFFYYGGENKVLFKHIHLAFVNVYGDKCGKGNEFLEFFKDEGYYLDDLCSEPINKVSPKERKQLRKENIPSLAKRVKDMKPESVIIIMKAIEKEIKEALRKSEWVIPDERVYTSTFPSFSGRNKEACVQDISEALRELK